MQTFCNFTPLNAEPYTPMLTTCYHAPVSAFISQIRALRSVASFGTESPVGSVGALGTVGSSSLPDNQILKSICL